MNIENEIIKIFSKNSKYIGDDCAYLSKTKQLISTDSFIENIHFDFIKSTTRQISHKFLVSNISDIQSCGGTPKYALINISFPKNKFKKAKLISNYIKNICNKFNIEILGGDTTSSEKFFLSMTIISSSLEKKKILSRFKTKIGDSIFVFQNLGFSKIGYLNLYENMKLPKSIKIKSQKQFLEPRYYNYSDIFKKIKINSCMDISDSLFDSLQTLSSNSKKKFIIDNLFDVNPSLMKLFQDNKEKYLKLILGSGEEYSPIFTMNKNNLTNRIRNLLKLRGIQICKIGYVDSGRGVYFNNKQLKRPPLFNHFKNDYLKQ